MTRSRLNLLGGFHLAEEGLATPLLSRKARALLTFLVLRKPSFCSREMLAALLWSGNDALARMNLRQTLSRIRKALPTPDGRFQTIGDSVAISLDDLDIDVFNFEAAAKGEKVAEREQAVRLYGGDLLAGFRMKEEPFEDWLRVERERLRGIFIGLLERLMADYLVSDDFSGYVAMATRLLQCDPLREDVHRGLMHAYARQGRLTLAMKQYDVCREALGRELHLQPDGKTQTLYQELRSRRQIRELAAFAEEPSPAHNLAHAEMNKKSRPTSRYVKSGGLNIAYQITGEGPLDMVYVQGWVSNLDFAWESPRLAHVLDRLGSFCRLIRVDKRGTGLSDRNVGFATLEDRMEDVHAVLDAVGSKRAVLFGSSEGGNLCMLFAALYPERTLALVLHGSFARGLWAKEYPWAKTRDELEQELAAIEREWGEPADLTRAAPSLMNDTYEREWFATYLRNSASPQDAIDLWRWNTEIDVRDILGAIHVPTLIVQRTGDRWVKVEEAHYLSQHIEGATYVQLPGDDHLIWGSDSDRLVDAIQDFVEKLTPRRTQESALRAYLRMEVSSPEAGANILRPTLSCQTDGQEIHQSGEGFAAVFARPSAAIRYAAKCRDQAAEISVSVRAAVHIGEYMESRELVVDAALALTSSLLDRARYDEIVVSQTVRDLVFGSQFQFDECGEIDLPDHRGRSAVFVLRGSRVRT